MNEQQNVNNPTPKPKKKRSFWWLKLLLILILFAAGIIVGAMLSSQPIMIEIMEELFPQYAVSAPETTPVPTTAPTDKPIEYKVSPTPAPKPSKAPVTIVSPEEQAKAETEEDEAEPETSAVPETDTTSAPLEILPLPSAEPETASVDTPVNEYIGIDAALEAALKHAVLDADDVFVDGVSREKDDGLVYYEVEFVYGDKEYEYEINAYTGAVESWKSSRADNEDLAAAASGSVLDLSSCVSVEDAKSTALAHAGYKEYEAKDLQTSLEVEGDKLVYDIEFRAGNYDYDYKVDAVSGSVIMVEKERD